jgi:hypothetical protein
MDNPEEVRKHFENFYKAKGQNPNNPESYTPSYTPNPNATVDGGVDLDEAEKRTIQALQSESVGQQMPKETYQPPQNYGAPIQSHSAPQPPKSNMESLYQQATTETDPDLSIVYEIVKLPSKGMFYRDGLSEVKVEYLTSKDEDILTTPSLIESGTVLDVILKRKIKTPNVNPADLLEGDKNAIILFLRASSYGADYEVNVADPRTGAKIKNTCDLTKLNYKEVEELPDEMGEFTVDVPMRKKRIKFRLLTAGEQDTIQARAKATQEAYGMEYNEYSTLKLKAHITEIEGNRDRDYISRFVDAMPVRDAITIKSKIIAVSPDVDMTYRFKAKDGYEFDARLVVGVDFFFPSL